MRGSGSNLPTPVDYKLSNAQTVFGLILWLFMMFCGVNMLAFGLVLVFNPQAMAHSSADRLWGLLSIPAGGWMAWMSAPWLRKVWIDLKRTTPVARLDETGILIDTGREPKAFFSWSDELVFELGGEPENRYLGVSNKDGLAARLKSSDVTAEIGEIHGQAVIFKKAYSGKA